MPTPEDFIKNKTDEITKGLLQNYQNKPLTGKVSHTIGKLNGDGTATLPDGSQVKVKERGTPGVYAHLYNMGNGEWLADCPSPVQIQTGGLDKVNFYLFYKAVSEIRENFAFESRDFRIYDFKSGITYSVPDYGFDEFFNYPRERSSTGPTSGFTGYYSSTPGFLNDSNATGPTLQTWVSFSQDGKHLIIYCAVNAYLQEETVSTFNGNTISIWNTEPPRFDIMIIPNFKLNQETMEVYTEDEIIRKKLDIPYRLSTDSIPVDNPDTIGNTVGYCYGTRFICKPFLWTDAETNKLKLDLSIFLQIYNIPAITPGTMEGQIALYYISISDALESYVTNISKYSIQQTAAVGPFAAYSFNVTLNRINYSVRQGEYFGMESQTTTIMTQNLNTTRYNYQYFGPSTLLKVRGSSLSDLTKEILPYPFPGTNTSLTCNLGSDYTYYTEYPAGNEYTPDGRVLISYLTSTNSTPGPYPYYADTSPLYIEGPFMGYNIFLVGVPYAPLGNYNNPAYYYQGIGIVDGPGAVNSDQQLYAHYIYNNGYLYKSVGNTFACIYLPDNNTGGRYEGQIIEIGETGIQEGVRRFEMPTPSSYLVRYYLSGYNDRVPVTMYDTYFGV